MEDNKRVIIVPYVKKYEKGVKKCLKRNFDRLNRMPEKEFSEWYEWLVNYSWKNPLNVGNDLFRNGYVICKGNEVVGYCGAYHYYSDEGVKYYNLTTWAIDKKYRFYMYTIMNMIMDKADVVTDFTPSKVVRKINQDMYGFEKIDENAYKFRIVNDYKIKCNIRKCETELDIDDDEVRKHYSNHIQFCCKCKSIEDEYTKQKVYYIYYMPLQEGKNGLKWVNIVYVSNTTIFSEHIKDIVSELYNDTSRGVLCDSKFLDSDKIKDIDFELSNRCRMVWKRKESMKTVGLLYSEIPMLRT